MTQERKPLSINPLLLLLSPEDEDLRAEYWNLSEDGYARLGTHRFGFVMIHRIVGQRIGLVSDTKNRLDHINRNKLDNRRGNFRLVTSRQNRINSEYCDNSEGVYLNESGRWKARIMINGQSYSLGTFANEKDAKQVYQDSKKADKPTHSPRLTKGYYFRKDLNKWQAYINRDYKRIQLGIYDTELEARKARLEAEKRFG